MDLWILNYPSNPPPLKKKYKKMEKKTFSFLSKNLWNLVCKHRVMFLFFVFFFSFISFLLHLVVFLSFLFLTGTRQEKALGDF